MTSERRRGFFATAVHGTSWTTSATVLQFPLKVGVFAVLARLIAPEEFGYFTMALVVVQFAMVFSQLGLGHAIVQRAQLTREHRQGAFAAAIILGVMLVLFVNLLAIPAATYFRAPNIEGILRVLSIVLVLDSVQMVAAAILQRVFRFRTLAIVNFASFAIGGCLIAVTLAVLGYGVWSLVYAYLAEALVQTVLLFLLVPGQKRPALNVRAIKDLLPFGIGMTAERIAVYIAARGDSLVIGRAIGAAGLGYYDRAYQAMAMPANFFGMAVDKVLFSVSSRIQDDPLRLGAAFRRGLSLTALILLPGGLVATVLAPELVYVILGPGWEPAVAPFQILVGFMFFRTGVKISATIARSMGAVYRLAWRHAVYAVVTLVGAVIGSFYGIEAVAIAVALAISMHFALLLHLNVRQSLLSFRDIGYVFAPAIRLAIGAGAIAFAIRLIGLELQLPLYGILLVTLTGVGLMVAAYLRYAPAAQLGADALWWLGQADRGGQGWLIRIIRPSIDRE